MVAERLSKGDNRPLTGSPVRGFVSATGAVILPDLIVLCLGAGGKVHSDGDFVFYNQPRTADGTVELTAQGLAVDLAATSTDVDRLVIAVSFDASLAADAGLSLTVVDDSVEITVPTEGLSDERAVILAEIYRRAGGWKLRNISQGYSSGLAGLARDYGVSVDEQATPPPHQAIAVTPPVLTDSSNRMPTAARQAHDSATPGPPISMKPAPQPASRSPRPAAHTVRPDWHLEPDTGWLRWWDGSRWTDERVAAGSGPDRCARCGQQLRARRFGSGYAACKTCENQVAGIMSGWRRRAAEVIHHEGPAGPRWDGLWVQLRHARINEDSGRQAIRASALDYLQRHVTFAFADGSIDRDEVDAFESLVAAFGLADPAIDAMRSRLARGLDLATIRDGNLPVWQAPDVHLDLDEILYLDVRATHVRILASGPKENPGRLLITNKKLRFIGSTSSGSELTWPKIVTVRAAYGAVSIEATTARGGGTYRTSDSEYAAAVIEGALRVSKRLVLSPGERDSATIPQHVKAAVWQRDGGRCVQCGENTYLEFDHVIPRSKGGATSEANIQLLCRRCNQQKSDRI